MRLESRRDAGITFGSVGEQEQLAGIDPLGSRAVQPPQQEVEAVAELLDLAPGLPQAGRQLADHAVAGGQVVGQRRGLHGPILASGKGWRKAVLASICHAMGPGDSGCRRDGGPGIAVPPSGR